jgi:hypothetical protein
MSLSQALKQKFVLKLIQKQKKQIKITFLNDNFLCLNVQKQYFVNSFSAKKKYVEHSQVLK